MGLVVLRYELFHHGVHHIAPTAAAKNAIVAGAFGF
jgi:hypothetical protein